MDRYGIATAGNWIVDRVKMIGHWPDEETLALIGSEERGGGGGAYNCIADLHQLGATMPLYGIGLVGEDTDGQWLRADLEPRGVDLSWVHTTGEAPTSYTDVYTVTGTGKRTFFHNYGACARFGPEHIPFDEVPAKVIHLAYLLLLPVLDSHDPDYGCVGARVLARLKAAGLKTVLDLVTEDSPRVQSVVHPALPHVDCFIVNELEAGVVSGIPTRSGGELEPEAVRAAARRLLELGVNEMVAVHMPEGGYAVCRDGRERFEPSLLLPDGFIVGSNGAGDAFAAGVLYGLHEDWDLERTLGLGVATAAACLRHPTTTRGVGAMDETLGLLEKYPRREPLIVTAG